ncbi:secreted RxLR effector protein 161-like [Lathyrus oleraceus]|uniref:secreted RxLR effector protein 161-like n=1 Tax=Pisum sativum TaxID=3888 RepID=UPI0021D11615|nr:secreted RxLR effector protein 161-like [Pisum sativum]
MLNCNAVVTSVESGQKLEEDNDEERVYITMYKQMIGSLRYICNSRPDINFIVGLLSKFMHNPRKSHMLAGKRVLIYIKGTLRYCVFFSYGIKRSKEYVIVFSDSNWCGDILDRRSTTCYVFKFQGAPISWISKKKPIVALSSCEAEYIAICSTTCQAAWIEFVLTKLGVNIQVPIKLIIDNKSTIDLAKNFVSHGRSNHIEIRFHYIRE